MNRQAASREFMTEIRRLFRRPIRGAAAPMSRGHFTKLIDRLVPSSNHILARGANYDNPGKIIKPTAPGLLGVLPLSITPEVPSTVLVVSIVTGLPAALWLYKCFMMVLFQRRIIYMGYAPLGARTEEITTHVPPSHLRGISCEEISVSSEGKIALAGIVVRQEGHANVQPGIVIMYLQGNAGNPLHRLPVFQQLLHAPAVPSSPQNTHDVAVVAVAPRSYWKSTPRRPTEHGLLADYLHTLHYILDRFPSSRIILYGHSLGGAAAVCLLSNLHETTNATQRYSNIKGFILENPFASIPGMVRALYPQRWLPYRHLAPLAFDKWDAAAAMCALSAPSCPNTTLKRLAGNMLVLLSENDEIVPPAMGTELYNTVAASSAAAAPRMVVVKDALHENAWDKRQWLPEMKRYIGSIRMEP